MANISSTQQIEKIIGNTIATQSELPKSHIMNMLSIRGADLSKFITNNVKLSYNLDDVVILFEISSIDSEGINFTEETSNNTIRESQCFKVQVILYGNQSAKMIRTLKARFETESVRYDLLSKGIYFVSSEDIAFANEFMNNTIWIRTDWSFKIACEMTVQQVDNMSEYEQVNLIDEIIV